MYTNKNLNFLDGKYDGIRRKKMEKTHTKWKEKTRAREREKEIGYLVRKRSYKNKKRMQCEIEPNSWSAKRS